MKKEAFQYNGVRYTCSLALVMDMIGDKYKSLILFHLQDGPLRSGELQRTVEGLSNRMFTFSIRALEKDGLVKRTVEPTVPPAVTYELTSLGLSLLPGILQLDRWGKDLIHEQGFLLLDEE